MNILLPGQYPRSEALVAASRDLDRERILPADLEAVRQHDIESLKELQKGFSYITTGFFEWQDLMRPFSTLLQAEVGTLKRFYETNTFWKILEIHSQQIPAEDVWDIWIQRNFFGSGGQYKDNPLVFTLPFLFLFKEYSNGISLEHIADILVKTALKLSKFPHKLICFYEPTFGWRSITPEEKEMGLELIQKIKALTSTPIYIYSSFFPLEKDLKYIYSLPADGYGIDFYANSLQETLPSFPKGKTLLAGIINTQSTLIDPENGLEDFLLQAVNYVEDKRIYITPNGPAELLPRAIMDQKVKHVKKVCRCPD
ncbi:MAG: hypothetical protein WC222_03280 [Parachlamydiales bacterium]|jgi:5-methyltetrahydropteroyltriglutamate--homocysteine methyltransferase